MSLPQPTRRRHSRWLRFSLRSLLLAVTICGLVLAPLAVQLERAHEQREIVRELRVLGAKVHYDWQFDRNYKPIRSYRWLRPVLGDDFFNRVNGVSFDDGRPAARVMPSMGKLPHLTLLVLAYMPIDGAELRHISSLNKLVTLDLQFTPVGDDGLQHIAKLDKLQWLGLWGTNVSDAELHRLAGLSDLKVLVLTDTKSTPEGKARVRQMLPGCEVF